MNIWSTKGIGKTRLVVDPAPKSTTLVPLGVAAPDGWAMYGYGPWSLLKSYGPFANGPNTASITSAFADGSNGSIGELMWRLQEFGVPIEPLIAFACTLDTTSLGPFLRYLQTAALDDSEFTLERLALYVNIARSIDPSLYEMLRRFVREVRHKIRLSPDVARLVEAEDVEHRLYSLLLTKFGLNQEAPLEPRTHQTAFLRSTLAFLENFNALVAADPNLALLFQMVNRYGGVQAYYAGHETPRRTVQRLIELGYNVDHMVFGGGMILSLGPSESDLRKPWAAWLRDTIRRLVGGRDIEPEIDLEIDRGKFFHDIKHDFKTLQDNEDEDAGLRLVNRLLPQLEKRQASLLRVGDVAAETQIKQVVLELHAIRKQICGDSDHLPAQRLVAIRSPKLVPELLFDNTRLSCCLFKPNGLFHGEICRLILDPATPIIEFWLEPYPEFLGLATCYVGLNGHGERTILMDTVDYNDLLHDLRGYNGTMRFMLHAIVADAHLSGASKVAVFAAPWGKPLGFANFVKLAGTRSRAIRYRESYYLEAADPADGALAHSLLGRHHYTEAFGYDNPLAGVIDYSFSLVGWGSVQKLYTGGRGVYEIDVATYLEENNDLAQAIGTSGEPVAREPAQALFVPRDDQEDEIAWRKTDVVLRWEDCLSNVIPDARIERVIEPESALIDEILDVETSAFPTELRYSREQFIERLILKEVMITLIREGSRLAGFALSHVMPAISWQDVFVEDLAVRPDMQSKGIGSALVSMLAEFSAISGYRGLYVSAEISPTLTRFYERLHFRTVAAVPHIGQIFYRPFSLLGLDRAEAITAIQRECERKLKDLLSHPNATVHSALDPDLLRVLLGLEAAFPDEVRYGQEAIRRRMLCSDAYVLVLWEQREPIASCLSFHDPSLPKHAITIDSIAVRPELQRRGIGRILMDAALKIPTQTCYTVALLNCRERSLNGVDLISFYRSFGGKEIGRRRDDIQMRIDLRAPRARPVKERSTAPAKVRVTVAAGGNSSNVDGTAESSTLDARELIELSGTVRGNRSNSAHGSVNAPSDKAAAELIQLPYIDRDVAARLRQHGVCTVDDFLRLAGPREGRVALAEDTGIEAAVLLRAAHFAEMARAGVQLSHLGRLNRSRITTLGGLRACSFDKLRRTLPSSIPDGELKRYRDAALALQPTVEG